MMSKTIDSEKYAIVHLASNLVKTAQNQEDLTEKVILLLTQRYKLESEKQDLLYFIESLLVEYKRDEVIKVLKKYSGDI
jgi:hypothetical protein